VVSCGAAEAECVCILDAEHDGPHECSCKGSWHYIDGEFVGVTLPGGQTLDQAFESLFGGLF
jgi:hypothetical protein